MCGTGTRDATVSAAADGGSRPTPELVGSHARATASLNPPSSTVLQEFFYSTHSQGKRNVTYHEHPTPRHACHYLLTAQNSRGGNDAEDFYSRFYTPRKTAQWERRHFDMKHAGRCACSLFDKRLSSISLCKQTHDDAHRAKLRADDQQRVQFLDTRSTRTCESGLKERRVIRAMLDQSQGADTSTKRASVDLSSSTHISQLMSQSDTLAANEARNNLKTNDHGYMRRPLSQTVAASTANNSKRKQERELLTHKLASASNAHLLQIAQFSKPKWQTITIVAMSVERWEMSFNTMAYWSEPDVATTDVEVLERSTLSDVRKLIAAFCSEIPKDFVFAELYRLMRSKDEEASMKIEDILEENRAVVLHKKRKDAKMQALSIVASRSSSTSALNTQSTTTRSLYTTMLNTQSSQSLKQLPAFSFAQQFGEVHAIADIYLKKTKGFTLKLRSFRVGHHAEAHVEGENGELCDSERRHTLSNSREKCLELLPASIDQMVTELQRNFLLTALCHLSFVSEVLAAAIEDNWRIAVLKCVDVKKRSLVFKVINLLLKIDTRIEPSAKATLCLRCMLKFGWHENPLSELPVSVLGGGVAAAAITCEEPSPAVQMPRLLARAFRNCSRTAKYSLASLPTTATLKMTGEDFRLQIAEPNAWTQPPRIVFVKDEWCATSVVECFWMISRCMVDLVKCPTIATEIQDDTAFIRSICTTICGDYCAYLTHANLVLLSAILRDLVVCKRRAVTDAVDISAFVPLLDTRNVETCGWAYQCVWSLLRNRETQAGFVDRLVRSIAGMAHSSGNKSISQSISPESITLRRVKEAAYASDLDDRGLEAVFGILAQLAKSAALHSAILTMDESLPAVLFFGDPGSLLSAIIPMAKEPICTQQAKLRDELRVDEYLQEVEGSDELICRDELQQIFEENDRELLQGIHQILATNIDASGPASIHAQKAVCASINAICNVMSSNALFVRLRTEVCNMASSEFVRLLLTFVTATMGNDDADEASTKQHYRQRDELSRINALRILRRVTKLASVAELFGIRAESHSELLDLVFFLLHPLKIETAERCNQIHADDIMFHTLLVIKNVSLDSSAADAITTRIDALVHYIVCPRPSLRVCKAFWDTAYNLVGHNLHLVKLSKCFSETLEEHLVNPNLERTTPSGIPELVDVITKTLRKVAESSIDSHANLVQLLPSYNHFLTTGADTHGFVLTPSSLESIALAMSYIMGHILHICKLHGEVPELEQEHHRGALPLRSNEPRLSFTQTRGMQVAIERLICSLCELLSSFHEDENKSIFQATTCPGTLQGETRHHSLQSGPRGNRPCRRLRLPGNLAKLCSRFMRVLGGASSFTVKLLASSARDTLRLHLSSTTKFSGFSWRRARFGYTSALPTTTTRQQQAAPSTSDAVNVVDTFLLKYVQCIAVLSERSHFLQSTYYLVHASEKESVTIPSLIIAATIHSKGCSSHILLASKTLSRFLSVFSLQEAKRLFSTCITQIARTLGWQVTPLDVSLALVAMVGQTESEVIMKTRVAVKVIHSMLLRTAILGLISKGIPGALHDFGMAHMMAHMERLLLHCKRYELASRIGQRSGSSSIGANERAYRSASPPSAYRQTPVEKWMPTNLFTSGSYNEAGSTALAYGGAQLEECVASLKELAAEIVQYTVINFKLVFQSFESMNDDLELIEAMASSEHAIMFTQSMFSALRLLQEALTTSLLDEEDGGNETGVSNRAVSSSSSRASLDGEPLRADLVGETMETLQLVELFPAKFAQIMEWIIVSLQHSDMDVLFYATQLQALLELTTRLFDIPTGLNEDQRDGAEREAEMERPRPPSTAQERVHSFSAVPFGGTSDAAFKCHFEADDPDVDAMRTWFRDIPHTLDVEIWIYLPFWYQDVLISHLKLPLLTKFIDKKPFEFQYCPERSRGVRAYQPKALGTLVLDMCTSISSRYEQASSNTDHEFPAYSTLGSRKICRVLRAIGSTLFGFLKRVYGATTQFIQEETLLTRGDRRRMTLVTDTDLLSGDDAKTDTSTKKSVEALMKQILDVLRQSIHPDKLVGSYEKLNAAKECEILMAVLESTAIVFPRIRVLVFLGSFPEPPASLAAITVACSFAKTEGSISIKKTSFPGFLHSLSAKKRVFREVSSQLRYLGAPNVKDTAAEAPTQKTNTGLAWYTNSLKLVPAAKLLQTLKDNDVVTRVTKASLFAQASDDNLLAARASVHLHNAASKTEWRMLSPHVSLWNLAQERVPE
ncbi:hypothetical protein FI667_g16070, partial [Globisporangium splendens]